MREHTTNRILDMIEYILQFKTNIEKTADVFNVSTKTIHDYIYKKLPKINDQYADMVQAELEVGDWFFVKKKKGWQSAGPGRSPRASEPTKPFPIRFTPTELTTLTDKATQSNLTLSEYIRNKVLEDDGE